jgi:TfoX/Sxy family transcriptional regulator of competence genes
MDISGKLKYVGIELMRKDAKSTDTPETGLFRGVRTRSEEGKTLSLILTGLKDKPNDIRALNTEVFNVMTLMFVYGDNKEMVVFRNDETDQKQAQELLTGIVEQLKSDELMLKNDPEIVDLEKFEDVPGEFFAPKKKGTTGTTSTYRAPGTSATAGSQTEWQKTQAAKKKEEEQQEVQRWTPFMLSRGKKDKPLLKDLNIIKKKVQSLAAGDYERELPDPAPVEKEKEKKTQVAG